MILTILAVSLERFSANSFGAPASQVSDAAFGRAINGEARGEPYEGQVVGAVILN